MCGTAVSKQELLDQGVDTSAPLTIEQLKGIMPARQKMNITPEFVDNLNHLIEEPEFREQFRENVIGFVSVLNDPNTSLKGYIKAVKYVSYKIMGLSNQQSWVQTFPERFQRLVDAGKPEAYVRSLVCAYNKGQLVNRILEQSLVPTWVVNADAHQAAINRQVWLMKNSKSEKVQSDAANSLLTHLKRPEAAKLEIEIGIKDNDSIGELRREVERLGEAQKATILSRTFNAKDIAESEITDAEILDNDF